MNEIPEGMKALYLNIAAVITASATPFTAADALLAPDGPLWPALRALGVEANRHGDDDSPIGDTPLRWLEIVHGITGPLADACLAAAEVQP